MDTLTTSTQAGQTFTDFINELSLFTEEEINTVPFEGSWTPAQVGQHIILSAGGFVELLNGPVKDTTRDPEAHIPELKESFLNFQIKMESPAFIIPEDRRYNKAELIPRLEDIRYQLLLAIKTLETTKTCIAFELPVLGHLTRAEAITFAIVHTQRHIHQLRTIRSRMKQ